MRIHSAISGSRVNGPGLRSVLWCQGCSLKCPGCWNPQTHDPDAGFEYYSAELAERIFANCLPGTDGLTISGGEPMEQAVSLGFLLHHVKARRPDWSIGLFTGYTHRELADGDYAPLPNGNMGFRDFNRDLWHGIRRYLDFGILGRYDRTKPTGAGALVSSANQEIVLFSTRYSLSDFEPLQLEFSIEADGLTQITGFPV